jgi:CO dehydrogenase/acetyl-CoA synthase beta subunit
LEIFNEDITRLRAYVKAKQVQGRKVRLLDSGEGVRRFPDFLKPKRASIVLAEDTWLELGNPGTFSTAPALVTDRLDLVNDGAVTLIGPDIPEVRGSLPFAQILLIASGGLEDEDYRKINTFQYELELKGYMIKAVPSSLTIWSRVSKESARDGLSFEILGKAIIDSYKSEFNDTAIEIIFITSSKEDVGELRDLHKKVIRIISAMNKMMQEMSFDCSSCEYLDVCGDVRQLGSLREKLMKKRKAD